MAKGALGAHSRDELGISKGTQTKPLQAARSSAAAFVAGTLPPVLLVPFFPLASLSAVVMGVSWCFWYLFWTAVLYSEN